MHLDSVLRGAEETLWRLRPVVFATVDGSRLTAHAQLMKQFGYRCWRVVTPFFRPDNFNRQGEDFTGGRSVTALLAVPEETSLESEPAGAVELVE